MRDLYNHRDLSRLLHPSSIAIVGASSRTGSFGLRTIDNLKGFGGRVYPVNPKYGDVGGLKCYPSLAELPERPDCVVLAVNRDLVEAAVKDSVAVNAGGIIVYAAGFAETARPDLVALQDGIVSHVLGTKTRLIGPNCLGVINYSCSARILFGRMPEPEPLRPAAIGIVTQSGSVAMSLGQAVERGVSISHAIPVGNGADVGIADVVAYLAEDDACRSIACIFEGLANPAQLVAAARLAARNDKPLVVYKMATSEQGAAAAMSHTGALAGSHNSYAAALKNVGAVMVDSLEDVIETAAFFAKAGRPKGRGVSVVVGSGGLGVIAADKAEDAGVALPQPEGRTLEMLRRHVPEFGAARNPCDVTAQALNDESALRACADAMLSDPAYGTMVVVHPYADKFGAARVPLWAELAEEHGKIICNYWATEALEGYGVRDIESQPDIATFRSLGRCFRAIAGWLERAEILASMKDRPARIAPTENVREVGQLLAQGAVLAEREAKAALALYGIPVVGERLVASPAEAGLAAQEMGFPVVLKIESPDILHKTDMGVIRLGLRDRQEVEAAAAEILGKAEAVQPAPRINGILVQPMVPAGVELMMGCRVDPAFGPFVVVGLGGVMVELVKDSVMEPAPVTPQKARQMLGRLRTAAVLKGFRGLPAVDLDRLCDVIARFSEFVADHAGIITEADVNPLICNGSAIMAVDAIIVTQGSASARKHVEEEFA
jgi:acetyl-CoA synthetase